MNLVFHSMYHQTTDHQCGGCRQFINHPIGCLSIDKSKFGIKMYTGSSCRTIKWGMHKHNINRPIACRVIIAIQRSIKIKKVNVCNQSCYRFVFDDFSTCSTMLWTVNSKLNWIIFLGQFKPPASESFNI